MMDSLRRKFVIRNDKGLHARAAATLLSLVSRYDATVTLYRNGMKAECDSILSVLTLACPKDSELEVEVMGADAETALDEIGRLIEDGFGENGQDL